MRVFFHALRLAVAAAVILTPAHRAHASSVCIVMSNESEQFNQAVEGFKKHLARQGVSAEIKIHTLSRAAQRPEDIALAVSQAGATHLLALGSPAARIVAQARPEIPLIAGLVISAAEITGIANATGVYLEIPLDVQLAMIQRLFPKARTVGLVYSMENAQQIAEASKIARKYGLNLEAQEAFAPKDIPYALEAAVKKSDVLWGLLDKVVLAPETAKQILLFSLRNGLPFIGPSENWAKAGAAAAFGWNFEDLGEQCGEVYLKLLKGAEAAALAPVGPRKIEYALNLNTADRIRVDFSTEIINASKHVFNGE